MLHACQSVVRQSSRGSGPACPETASREFATPDKIVAAVFLGCRRAKTWSAADRRRLGVAISNDVRRNLGSASMSKIVMSLISVMFLAANQTAQGQVTVDVSKITCEQFVLYKIADPKNIAIWLSGYLHGQNNSTVVEPQAFESNLGLLKDYCMTN